MSAISKSSPAMPTPLSVWPENGAWQAAPTAPPPLPAKTTVAPRATTPATPQQPVHASLAPQPASPTTRRPRYAAVSILSLCLGLAPSLLLLAWLPWPGFSNRPPAIEFASTSPAAPRSGDSVRVKMMALDPDGDAVTWQYRLDAAAPWIDSPAAEFELPPLSTGVLALEVRATDARGQVSEIARREFSVAGFRPVVSGEPVPNKPPQLEVAGVEPLSPTSGGALVIRLQGTDPERGDLRYEYRVSPAQDWLPAQSGVVLISPLQTGSLEIEMRVLDELGLASEIERRSFVVAASAVESRLALAEKELQNTKSRLQGTELNLTRAESATRLTRSDLESTQRRLSQVEFEKTSAASRASTAESRLADIRRAHDGYQGVVTIRNSNSVPINYQLRWQGYDGQWIDWASSKLDNGKLNWHYAKGVIGCEIRFDYIAGDGQTTYKTYFLNFHRYLKDGKPAESDGKKYHFTFNSAGDRIDLVAD